MLNQLTLTNFQRHEHLVVDFAPGLNAVKAPNEGGKSTLLRAIAYALFGVKALPVSLEEAATWGKPASALKVELTFTLHNVQYRVTRSKAGAEVRHGDEVVTGQSETAKFIADLLGADAGMAAKLLIANQGDVQGALAGGDKGASELIEKLADFQQLDRLIDTLQTHLVTGSPVALKARLEQAQATLDAAQVEALDEEAQRREVDALKAEAASAKQALQEADDALRSAESSRNAALAQEAAQSTACARLEERQQAYAALLSQEPAKPSSEPPRAQLDEARQREVAALVELDRAQAFIQIQAINAETVAYWGEIGAAENTRFESNLARAEEELKTLQTSRRGFSEQAQKAHVERAKLEAMVLTGACTACGQDMSDVPQVQERNALLRQQIEGIAADIARLGAKVFEAEFTGDALAEAIEYHRDHVKHPAVSKGWARVDDIHVPGRLVWVGAEPMSQDDAQAAVTRAKADVQAAADALAQHDLLTRTHADWQRRVEAGQQALAAAEKAWSDVQGELQDLSDLRRQAEEARQAREHALAFYEATQQRAAQADSEAQRRIADHRAALKAREHAEKDVAQCRDDLQKLEFNNALLKAVREARPAVTNRLWSLVLSAVSSYFSDMRGVPSVVTKAQGGFKVDGHSVSGLSGSTKDALGLAIRVALLRTFLPGLSLLILDEPNAAMDDERTAQVLGFVAGAGFDQTLIVSHDEMTVDVANHIITLE